MKALVFAFLFCTFLPAASSQTTVFLVRHAEKLSDGQNPALSDLGEKRALRLLEMLQEAEIQSIYSTDYKRTLQTVGPLAEHLGIKTEIYEPFYASFHELVKQKNERNLLIVGHSNTIPGLVNALIGQEKYQNLSEDQYDLLFVVTLIDGYASDYVLRY